MIRRDLAPLGFRRDIQVLRGVAVLLVLAYHASFGLPGGFIGVDVFFVLSGFLIATLLVEEAEIDGRVDLTAFWGRRFRRLLPASFVVLVAILAWAWIALPRIDLPQVASTVRAAGLYVANFAFILKSRDYLEAVEDPEPVLHFWSLAVEEQFYFVIPLLVAAVVFVVTRRGNGDTTGIRSRVIGLFAVIVIASFVAMQVAMDADRSFAFFSSPTRAWQFALGAMLGVGGIRVSKTVGRPLGLLSVVGLIVIAAVYTERTIYPGLNAVVPTLAALGAILGGPHLLGLLPRALIRAGEHAGEISYSLYLWHWPLLEAVRVQSSNGPGLRAVALLTSWGLAVATLHLVEDPVRRGAFMRNRGRTPFLAGASLVSIVAGSVALAATVPDVPTSTPDYRAAARERPELYDEGAECDGGFGAVEPTPCEFGVADEGAPVITLVGDSHAGQWFTPLLQIANDRGMRLRVVTKSSCPIIPGITTIKRTAQEPHKQCPAYVDETLAQADLVSDSALVILTHASNYGYHLPGDESTWFDSWEDRAAWDAGLRRTLTRIGAMTTAELVFLGDTARPPEHVPRCLSEPPYAPGLCDFDYPFQRTELDLAVAVDEGWNVINPLPWLCSDGSCPVVRNGTVLYRDASHISEAAAIQLVDQLAAALPSTATEASP